MEYSETQEQVINLGKALVQELELEPSVDTLGRWMAHYIAEQMLIAEKALGYEKTKAQQHCFDTILAVWNHRSTLPRGHRPFENFEPIFQTLHKLNPDNPQPFYWHQDTESDLESQTNEVKKWLDLALSVDNAARIIIEFTLAQAASNAIDEKTASWLKNTANLIHDDILIIRHFYPEENDNQENIEQIKKLESKIEKLNAFLEIGESLRSDLTNEIKQLS